MKYFDKLLKLSNSKPGINYINIRINKRYYILMFIKLRFNRNRNIL